MSHETDYRLHRRRLLQATLAAALPLPSRATAPDADYPNRPIRLVAPYPPGGQTDIVARIVAQPLGVLLGRPVVVENRSGGGGTVGHELVAKSPPDGYTLVVGNSAMLAVAPSVIPDLPFKPLEDFAPVTVVGGGPLILEVNPRLPVRNLTELVAYSKANPGKLNYGISAFGSIHHLLSEQIKLQTGASWTYVPYKSNGQMISDLIAGQLDLTIDNIPSSIEYIRAGRLRALAVSQPTQLLADTPTIVQSGVEGTDAWAWHAILAPAGTPEAILSRLAEGVRQLVKRPEVAAQMAHLGLDVIANTPTEFRVFLRDETRRWARVAKDSGARAQ
jgi:tripartite-type tricarboxylate transporter receptor subunit TctC